MWRHALDLLAHCSERPPRPRIDTERHRLAAAQPAADVCPVIDRARSQHLGIARHEGAPDCPLYRPAALGRSARPFAQVRMLSPFHRGPRRTGYGGSHHGRRRVNMSRFLVTVCAFGLLLSFASAEEASVNESFVREGLKKTDLTRYVPSGISRTIWFVYAANPDCSSPAISISRRRRNQHMELSKSCLVRALSASKANSTVPNAVGRNCVALV